jgi:hypothetical protein
MDKGLIQEIVKGGVSVILSVGIIVILYQAIVGDGTQSQFLQDHMARQTVALETLVKIYSGG